MIKILQFSPISVTTIILKLFLLLFISFTGKLSAQPYVGEIKLFAGTFAPNGWLLCEGQSLSIAEHDVLFALIGTTYGGDGQTTFNLPDLRGRVPMHMGTGPDGIAYQIGEMGGQEQVTLTLNQIPAHTHALLNNAGKGESINPTSNFPARNAVGASQYGNIANGIAHPSTIGATGGNQPHENMQPFLAINYIISLYGIFPSQTKNAETSEYMVLHTDGTITPHLDRGTDPFLSEIKIFSFNFVPRGFAQCNGQLLPINQNQALFSLLGTNYGGNGQINFALPNLRGRVPIGLGNGYNLGQSAGQSATTVSITNLPAHNHSFQVYANSGNTNTPAGNLISINNTEIPSFSGVSASSIFAADLIANVGGSQPHNNMQPYLTLNYCIALQGIFPSQNKNSVNTENLRYNDAFIGEIILMGNNFPPIGFTRCEGQLLPISQNTALFSLLGTTYGGNGKTNFALPDLMGRVALQAGQGPGLSLHYLGNSGGESNVTLTLSQIPSHTHAVNVANISTNDSPLGNYFGPILGGYHSGPSSGTLNSAAILPAGGGSPHNNMMPYLTISYYIALQGIYPQRP